MHVYDRRDPSACIYTKILYNYENEVTYDYKISGNVL
jgi:hypothetical protein